MKNVFLTICGLFVFLCVTDLVKDHMIGPRVPHGQACPTVMPNG